MKLEQENQSRLSKILMKYVRMTLIFTTNNGLNHLTGT